MVPEPFKEEVLVLVGGEQLVTLSLQLPLEHLVGADEVEQRPPLPAEVEAGDVTFPFDFGKKRGRRRVWSRRGRPSHRLGNYVGGSQKVPFYTSTLLAFFSFFL